MTNPNSRPQTYSALELMAFFDGELDPEKTKEIEDYLSSHPDVNGTLLALNEQRSLIQNYLPFAPKQPQPNHPQIDLTNSILSTLDQTPSPLLVANHTANDNRQPIPTSKPQPKKLSYKKAALISVSFAAAAAAIFAFNSPKPAPNNLTQLSSQLAQIVSSTPTEEAEASVTVETVDFGERSGAVFYIDGTTNGQTAVVWLNEEETLLCKNLFCTCCFAWAFYLPG